MAKMSMYYLKLSESRTIFPAHRFFFDYISIILTFFSLYTVKSPRFTRGNTNRALAHCRFG